MRYVDNRVETSSPSQMDALAQQDAAGRRIAQLRSAKPNVADWSDDDIALYTQLARASGIADMPSYARGADGRVAEVGGYGSPPPRPSQAPKFPAPKAPPAQAVTCPHCGKSFAPGQPAALPPRPAPFQQGRAESIPPPATT